MKRLFLLIFFLFISVPSFATDFTDTDYVYGWNGSAQFYQTWADHKAQLDLLYQPLDSDLTAISALTTTAYGRALLEVADEPTFKALVNLEAGTDFYSVSGADAAFQPLDADLTTLAGPTAWRIFYSNGSSAITELALGASGTYLKSNGATSAPTFDIPTGGGTVDTTGTINAGEIPYWSDSDTLAAYTEAEFKTAYNLEAGTDYYSVSGADAAFQTLDSDLTSIAALTTTAYGRAFLEVADEPTFKALVNLEAGTDFYSISAADAAFEGELNNSAGLLSALSDETGTGVAVFNIAPNLQGQISYVGTAVDDDDCTGDQGKMWWDSVDTQFEFCNANSGTPIVVGSATGTVDTTGTVNANEIPYFSDSDTLAAYTEAEFKAAYNLEAGTDYYSISAADAAFEGELDNSAGLLAALSDETGTGVAVFSISPTLTTPNLGTPSAATLTNATGLPISTGVSGLGANVATFLATPSSANLASALTDETGSGLAVFATSPTLTTPNLGTPSAINLTNATALPATALPGSGTWDAGTMTIDLGDTTLTIPTLTGDIIMAEEADHASTPGAGYGYIWVKSDTPSSLIFTDDAGTDYDLTAASSGDVESVGDCTSGACLDGTSDGGTYLRIYDGDSNYIQLDVGDLSGDITVNLPTSAGTLLYSGGAGGEPSSITLTNGTGLPSSGISDGDLGDVSISSGTITLDNDVVAAAEMADADHGDVSWTSGVATVEAVSGANAVDSDAYVDGSIDSIHISTIVESIAWNAAGINVDGTQCADPAAVTINSGPIQHTIICTDNDASSMYGHVIMPDSWDGGTVTFELEYLQTAADTNVLNADVTMQCRGATETVNSTWGTEVAIDDAALTGSNAVDTTTSAAVTPNGTCAGGDTLYWRVQIDATGTTTAAATLHFLGAKIEYTSNVGD